MLLKEHSHFTISSPFFSTISTNHKKKMVSRQPFPSNSNPKTSKILISITISASLIIIFAILYFLYFLYHSLIQRSRTSPFDSTTPFNKLQRFSYKELKNATHNFNDSNCIGKGGSGSVFTGMLKDGKLIAVKNLDSNSFQEFQNELEILSGLKFCSFIVSLLGFCVEKGRRVLVYEYLPNRSLQESLFLEGSNDLGLSWAKRFSIVLDIAKALAFLHLECEPAVIHGDVKPSNVLLDSDFRAKLSDFGLSRLKLDGEFGVDLFSQELWKSQELSVNSNAGRGGGENEENRENDDVDFSLALQASSSKNNCKIYHNATAEPLYHNGVVQTKTQSSTWEPFWSAINSSNFNFKFECENDDKGNNIKGKKLSVSENGGENWNKLVPCDEFTLDDNELNFRNTMIHGDGNGNNVEARQWGKDWWWRQDGSGELCSKDYVKEWIGSQICPSSNPEWDEEKGVMQEKMNLDNSTPLEKFEENPMQEPGFEYLDGEIEKEDSKRWGVCATKHRKMHEWWREENLEELNKTRRNNLVNKLDVWRKKRFKVPRFKKRRISGLENDQDMDLSFRKSCKKKKSRSTAMWSGDILSRELSSTTSMRGTICYVAPEYGGCGYLMEKADIYSFGVLILVILSGRRPLHILSSPMKFEKANLINWARHLARKGNVLELMDARLKEEYNKEEASLCINLALACLQKMPELRPDIGDVVKILKGEMELSPLPFEFSPSPPSKRLSRSRRKQNSGGLSVGTGL